MSRMTCVLMFFTLAHECTRTGEYLTFEGIIVCQSINHACHMY